jgi:hypothetical protein
VSDSSERGTSERDKRTEGAVSAPAAEGSALRRRYGAHPAHGIVLVLSGVPAGLALGQLLSERPREVATWLAGGAALHDGVLLPAYVAVDAAAVALWRRRPGRVAWLNFVRVPAAVSGLLLLIFSPVILGKAASFEQKTGRSTDAYAGRWLLVTAILFACSGAAYLARLWWVHRRGRI